MGVDLTWDAKLEGSTVDVKERKPLTRCSPSEAAWVAARVVPEEVHQGQSSTGAGRITVVDSAGYWPWHSMQDLT